MESMTGLTALLDAKTSDVSRWMLDQFPNHKPLLNSTRVLVHAQWWQVEQ